MKEQKEVSSQFKNYRGWKTKHPYRVKGAEMKYPVSMTWWSPVKECMMKAVAKLVRVEGDEHFGKVRVEFFVKRGGKWMPQEGVNESLLPVQYCMGTEDAVDTIAMHMAIWSTKSDW